jgi:transposase
MVKKFATTIDKVKIMTLWREGMSRKDISIHTIVPLRTGQRVILANHNLPETSVLVRNVGSGRPKKTSAATDRILKHTITKYPMMTAKELKEELAQELQNVSIRTIQHRIQKT